MNTLTIDSATLTRDYREHGFHVARGALEPADLEPVRGAIGRAVDGFVRGLVAKGKADELHAGESIETRLPKLLRGAELGRSWDDPVFGPEMHALIRHESIVSRLRPILGDLVRFDGGYRVRPKLPHSEITAFPFHQDSQYYGAGTEHAHIVSVWVPLVDVDEENGCLWIIPGSQRWGLLGGARGTDMNIRTFEDVESRGKAMPLPMRRGDIVLFSNLTVHGSKVNHTERVRWSVDLRYTSERPMEELAEAERASLTQYRGNLACRQGFRVLGADAPESFAAWRDRCEALRRS